VFTFSNGLPFYSSLLNIRKKMRTTNHSRCARTQDMKLWPCSACAKHHNMKSVAAANRLAAASDMLETLGETAH
jgi:hypothetical protein